MLDWGIDPLAPEKLPEVLGRYQVLLPIASGGVATVYLGSSVGAAGFEREVAIKLTHRHLRDSPEFFTQLLDEARLAGKIRHPNVVSVHDVGLSDKSAFIVMDYVEGESLSAIQQILKHRHARMPLPIALKILEDVLAGLHAAHELTDDDGSPLYVVHRDVTPHNILVGVDGVSRLTDFGVAKARARLTMTSPGLVKGKIAYMSPEQAQGKSIDRRVDVWAVGVVAWELFSGSRLHEGTNDPVLMLKIARDPPMRLRHVLPDAPRELDAVLATALSMDPRSRPPTAEAFSEALRAAAARSGVGIADARAVRDFLLDLAGPELEARRDKVAEIRALRQRWVAPGSWGPSEQIATEAAPQVPLVHRLEPTVVDRRAPPPAPPRRFARVSAFLSAVLTTPLASRAWVAVSIVPAVSLVLAWAVSSDGAPRVTRAISPPPSAPAAAPGPSAAPPSSAPPRASAPAPEPSERVVTPAELGEVPAADAAVDVEGVITPAELGVEAPADASGKRRPPPRPR